METTPHSLLEYFRALSQEPPADLPADIIERKAADSRAVATGFEQLWKAIHMRRQLNQLSPAERRELERDIRTEMSQLNREDPESLEIWTELHCIHHWSVTADQAEMLAAGFIR